jgi:two-component system nitrogen regulation response regulator NtrX
MSILIVDDEQDIRELIGDILRDEGYQTRLAANSDDCMAEINADPPALMIREARQSRHSGGDYLRSRKH